MQFWKQRYGVCFAASTLIRLQVLHSMQVKKGGKPNPLLYKIICSNIPDIVRIQGIYGCKNIRIGKIYSWRLLVSFKRCLMNRKLLGIQFSTLYTTSLNENFNRAATLWGLWFYLVLLVMEMPEIYIYWKKKKNICCSTWTFQMKRTEKLKQHFWKQFCAKWVDSFFFIVLTFSKISLYFFINFVTKRNHTF